MPEKNINFNRCDALIDEFEQAVKHPIVGKSRVYYTGVDLGTACVVMVVMDENRRIVAGKYEYADVVRDGMVVDYMGAIHLIKKMKREIEAELGEKLLYAAAAIPPGTDTLDGGAIKNVVQAAEFELTALPDEPTAANAVLNIQNGAIIDIGGGTTGISILRNGEVVCIADEPTGGTHFSLVVAGAYHKSFQDAELYKRNSDNHKELLPVLKPVIEKVSSIILNHIKGYDVKELYLVGGTCCLTGIEDIIEKSTGISTYKPKNPMFVTPLGIAMNCTEEVL